jgi:opacity protein-like surface antigen
MMLNTLTTATLQVGYGTARFLVYGEVGLAIGTASYTNNFGFAERDTAHGLVYGGGVEVRVADNISIFGEYNRVRLNEVQMLGTNAVVFPMLMDVDVRANVFKVGFNIHFGG